MAGMDCEKNLGGQEEVLQAGQWSRQEISQPTEGTGMEKTSQK